MGNFLSKLGRAASFAVPAGVALFAGGGLNAQSLMTAGQAGSQGFAKNEEQRRLDEYMKKQEEAAKFAALQNAINPRGNYQAQAIAAPKAGLLETISGGVGTGLDVYNKAKTLNEQRQAFDLNKEKTESGLVTDEKQQSLLDEQIAALKAKTAKEAAVLPDGVTRGSNLYGQDSTASSNFLGTLGKVSRYSPNDLGGVNIPMEGEKSIGGGKFKKIAAPSRTLGVVMGEGHDIGPEATAAISEGLTQRQGDTTGALQAGASLEATMRGLSRKPEEKVLPSRASSIDKVFTSLATQNPELSAEELLNGEVAQRLSEGRPLTGEEQALAISAIETAQSSVRKALDQAKTQADVDFTEFLYGPVRTKVSSDKLLSNSGALVFAREAINSGFIQNDGAGDVMMANGIIKMSDPGLGVRPAEVATIEEALPYLERMGLWVSGQQVIEGDRYSGNFRDKLMENAHRFYAGLQEQVEKKITAESETIKQSPLYSSATNPGGLTDGFLGTYRMVDVPFLSRDQAEAMKEIEAEMRRRGR